MMQNLWQDLLTKTMESSTVDSSHLRIMRFMRLARALRGVRVMRFGALYWCLAIHRFCDHEPLGFVQRTREKQFPES